MASQLQIPASIDQLHRAIEWLRQHLQKAGFVKAEIIRLELALEEAFVNSVLHGYKEKKGVIELEFKTVPSQHVEITLIDFGPPFDPLKEAPPIDCEKPIEEREVGGMGIYLMRLCVDEVKYLRIKDSNVLKFIKRFSQKK